MFKYGEYKIHFKHGMANRKEIRKLNKLGMHIPFAEKTICFIQKADAPKDAAPVAIGIAMCSLKDEFNRATGREKSFARMVANFTADKQVRRNLWKAFFTSDDGRFTMAAFGAYNDGLVTLEDLWSQHS